MSARDAIDHAQPPLTMEGKYDYLLSLRDLASGVQLAWQPIRQDSVNHAQTNLNKAELVVTVNYATQTVHPLNRAGRSAAAASKHENFNRLLAVGWWVDRGRRLSPLEKEIMFQRRKATTLEEALKSEGYSVTVEEDGIEITGAKSHYYLGRPSTHRITITGAEVMEYD